MPFTTPMLDNYVEHLASTGLRDGTIDLYLYHLSTAARAIDLETAGHHELTTYMGSTRDLAPETRKSILTALRRFYAWAHRQHHINHNPAIDLAPVTVPRSVARIADDNNILRGLQHSNPHERAAILLARGACLRRGEIAIAHPRDRTGIWLHVTGKGGKQRRVPLNSEITTALDKLEHTQGRGCHYFPGHKDPHLQPDTISRMIQRRTGHNAHSLRHAGATAIFRRTNDLRALQELLGHASLAITERYVHTGEEQLLVLSGAAMLTANPSGTPHLRLAA